MSNRSNQDYPTENINDASYKLARGLVSSLPVLGGIASEIFEMAVTPSIERRREAWFADLLSRFQQLEIERANFSFAKAFDDETFKTTLLLAIRHAQTNHNPTTLVALRNAVLNSALPESPDEIRQKMFIIWAAELTPWHIQILRLFETEAGKLPLLNLSDPSGWRGGIQFEKLFKVIEAKYPGMRDGYHVCIQIVGDLYAKGLIVNQTPDRSGAVQIERSPKLSPLARDFLIFISSPLSSE